MFLFRCKPMDAEECEAYTDVYWIKFHQISNARWIFYQFIALNFLDFCVIIEWLCWLVDLQWCYCSYDIVKVVMHLVIYVENGTLRIVSFDNVHNVLTYIWFSILMNLWWFTRKRAFLWFVSYICLYLFVLAFCCHFQWHIACMCAMI